MQDCAWQGVGTAYFYIHSTPVVALITLSILAAVIRLVVYISESPPCLILPNDFQYPFSGAKPLLPQYHVYQSVDKISGVTLL